MPREERMFGDVIDPSIRVGNHQRRAVALTVILEGVLIAALIVVPLMAIDVLPTPHEAIDAFVLEAPTPEPPPLPRATPPAQAPRPQVSADAAPIEPPREIAPEAPNAFNEAPPVDSFVGGSDLAGVFGDAGSGSLIAAPPSSPEPPAPVRVGSRISTPQKTRHVAPLYPDIARSARVQGTVIVEATIDATGLVSNARVLRGHPLLDGAALDAVRQWEFTPTLLNGVPTPVIMTVTVNFRLS